MPAKIPAVGAGAAAGASRGKRGGCGREEGDGREEGAAAPLEALRTLLLVAGDRVASALWRLLAKLSKQESANKTGHRWCQCHPPKQSKKADFCWARCCCLAHCASWTVLQDALMNGPHSVETFSNLFGEEGCILVRRIVRLDVYVV